MRSNLALRCPTCGAENPPYATFCLECGDPFTAPDTRGRTPPTPQLVPPSRLWLRPEVWLGALLVLLVLGFAGVDWWQQEDQAITYRAGQAAVVQHDWDRAAALFGRLGDYRDARQQASTVQAQVRLRNSSYRAGVTAGVQGDWIAAYSAFSTTLSIQATYSDTRVLYNTAAPRATQAVLAHTIYRRANAGTPGLYLARPDQAGWLLPGSDAQSTIWNIGQLDDTIIYDAPLPPGVPAPGPPGGVRYMGRILADGRQLLATVVGPTGPAPPHAVPAAVSQYDMMLMGQAGLWLYDYDSPRGTLDDVHGSTLARLSYYDLASHQIYSLLENIDSDYTLLNGNAGGPLLIGGYNLPGIGSGRTQLYRADSATHALQPVALLDGVVVSAQLSADSRYLLYTIRVALPQSGQRFDLGLIDLHDPAHPVATILESRTDLLLKNLSPVQAAFVPGPGPLRILIRSLQGTAARLHVHALADGPDITLWEGPLAQILGDGTTSELYWLDPSGQFVLFRVIDNVQTARLLVQPLAGAAPVAQVAIPLGSFPSFGLLTPPAPARADTYLLYGLTGYNDLPAIYSVLLHDPPARPLALWQEPPVAPDASGRFPIALASGVLAYPQPDNALGLRTVDGATELPPLAGVDMIWPLGQAAPVYLMP